jgi:hypothetical protein
MNTRVRVAVGIMVGAVSVGSVLAAQGGSLPRRLPSGTQVNPGTVTFGNGNYIVIGCISRSQGNTYVITESRPRPLTPLPTPQFRLEGDTEILRVHVGHTVEIGGPVSRSSRDARTLTVKSLTYLSTTCQKLLK